MYPLCRLRSAPTMPTSVMAPRPIGRDAKLGLARAVPLRIDNHARVTAFHWWERAKICATAAGEWLAMLPEVERPNLILASPFVRAYQTAAITANALGIDEHAICARGSARRDRAVTSVGRPPPCRT